MMNTDDHCVHCIAGNACGFAHTEACPECSRMFGVDSVAMGQEDGLW